MIKCKKCKKELDDHFIFCPWCGAKQVRTPLKQKKRANGLGSVYKLPGRRRKPWVVLISKGKKRIYAGYYETRTSALQALGTLSADNINERYNQTVEEIYKDWKNIHFENLTKSGKQGYKSSWKYFDDIKSCKMRDVKTDTLQLCINNAVDNNKSRAVCEKIKQLSSQLCKFAMQQDIINKNYAQFVVLPKQKEKEKEIFTDEEIELLFANDKDERAKAALALIYTGFRVDEFLSLETKNIHLEDNYVVGGLKTQAGKNRIVPINPKIKPYFKEWHKKAIENNTKYLITNSVKNKKDVKNFRDREFYTILEELKIQSHVDKNHPARLTPHNCRHTFASLAVKAGVKPEVLQSIIGHADYSTTADVYVHENIGELQSGMAKI